MQLVASDEFVAALKASAKAKRVPFTKLIRAIVGSYLYAEGYLKNVEAAVGYQNQNGYRTLMSKLSPTLQVKHLNDLTLSIAYARSKKRSRKNLQKSAQKVSAEISKSATKIPPSASQSPTPSVKPTSKK